MSEFQITSKRPIEPLFFQPCTHSGVRRAVLAIVEVSGPFGRFTSTVQKWTFNAGRTWLDVAVNAKLAIDAAELYTLAEDWRAGNASDEELWRAMNLSQYPIGLVEAIYNFCELEPFAGFPLKRAS